MNKHRDFLPISRADMLQRGWYYYDFLVITGDAYVDHPSFGTGMVVGIAAGTCLGIRLKAKEKKIRRGINRAARNVEHAFDNMTR